MSHRDLGEGDGRAHRNRRRSTTNQDPSFADSSGPLFSIYSKAADDEDNKMVERWQKDADGILIFTGLFSAAVATLLSVTVGDLRQNSQDTSAFYLGNIYGVLADPNTTRASIPSPVAKPPPFSPPRFAVWVNSLWFLSLVMSVSCALLATSLHQWARRYVRLTQRARCSPEKRARMRAFFSDGVDTMHISWVVEALPTLLHASLFLFFGGLVIFLFNVNLDVLTCVNWWIGFFLMAYGLITLLPLFRQDSPYYNSLSLPTWFLYASIQYATFKALAFIFPKGYASDQIKERCGDLRGSYHNWMSGGVDRIVEETVSNQSSKIDVRILEWTITTLGDDDSLEKFFEAIPGFFNSRLAKDLERDFTTPLLIKFWTTLDGFMGRTLSSNSIKNEVKSHRVNICRNITSMMPCFDEHMYGNLDSHFDQAPVSIEGLQAMARWFSQKGRRAFETAQLRAVNNLMRMQERDNRWIALVSEMYGVPERDLQGHIVLDGDNLLLATLIAVCRQAIHSHNLELMVPLTQFDIRHTLPELQHDFCTLWNELVQGARSRRTPMFFTQIFCLIRHLYIDLHQCTDAAPVAFSASTDCVDPIQVMAQLLSYPSCNIASHRRDSTPRVPVTQPRNSPDVSPHHHTTYGGSIFLPPVKKASIIAGPSSDPTTSHTPEAISPTSTIHISPHPTGGSPPGAVASALQDIPPAATLSHPLEGITQRDIVASCTEPDISEIVTKSTHEPRSTLTPVPASTSSVLNKSLASRDAGAASASNPSLLASSAAVPTSPPPHVPPSPHAEFINLLSSTTPSRPTGNATLPRLHARGLVNTGNMCFANAVLQLLVHSPPFRDLFRELGNLKGQREEGAPENDSGATPLVDATMRLFEEFMFNEKESPPTQQSLQQATIGKSREDEEGERENRVAGSFEPIYVYDVMKEKRQLKTLLDGQQQDAEVFFRLYLDTLDEEFSQSGLTEEGKRGSMASSVESLIMRIFGGRSHSSVRAPNQSDTVTIEDWRSLQLEIRHDSVHTLQLEDILAHNSQPQPVRVGPSSLSDASQQVLIEMLPPVLVLHLRRFRYDAAAGGEIKISKQVKFAPELEIPLDTMVPTVRQSAESVHYTLYGVLYHHGESMGGGHYSVDVLRPNDSGSGEGWMHIEDEAVSTVPHEDVFGWQGTARTADEWCAYMFFYRRNIPTRT